MKKIYMHIIDKEIIYKVNKIKIKKSSLEKGRINNLKEFINDLKKINKEEKINKNILGDEIQIVVNNLYTKYDIILLNNIFKELDYNQVKIKTESDFINNTTIIIEDKSARIFKNKKYYSFNNYNNINKIKSILEIKSCIVISYIKENNIQSEDYYYTNPYEYFLK